MPLPSSDGSVPRRRLLAGLAGLGTTAVAPATATARTPSGRARADATAERDPRGVERTLDPAGTLDLRGAAEVVVDDDGETAYCSVVDGFAVVDLSDPANPTLLAEERDLTHDGSDPMQSIMDVKVSGDRLLVSGPNGFGEGLSGFFLYDVSDPANPERAAVHETTFGPHNSFVDGDYVYLTGSGEPGQPVVVYDVSDDDPEEVARWKAADADDAWTNAGRNYRSAHDVYVQDDVLYVAYWDAGTWLVDVSDPTEPTAVAHLGGHDPAYLASLDQITPEFRELPGNSHYVQPNADASAVFVGKEAWDAEGTEHDGGPGGIECWDLSGSEPELRSVLQPPEPDPDAGEDPAAQWTSHNFGVDGDRLYASWYGGGVRAYDVADLAEPSLLGAWRDPETTAFWTAKPTGSGFVAASYVDPRNAREAQRDGEGARVFAFPEPDASNAEPAPTMARREFPDPDPSDDDGSSDDERSGDGESSTDGSGSTDDDGETTSAPATPDTDGESTTASTTVHDDPGSTPGFGVLTALAGGGLGAWRLLAADRDDDR
ncbi:LVIVD repeat-containing protein [Halorubellus salinus]|uniref:LVIVD repeat-containing protein n=1 Tax=Halorubellus salinus TaxID=755309 RepID=UPI001D0803B4|nr:hypothetical protein [Halorubellus salinus]